MRERGWVWGILFFCLLGAADLSAAGQSPIDDMLDRFEALTNYTTLLDSEGEGGRNRILYTYQKPGFIRMDFIEPHKGARLIYNPEEKKVTLWPFSAGFFHLRLSPENSLITDPKGHTVDRSDMGSLLRSVKALADQGTVTLLEPERVEDLLCPGVEVEAAETVYRVWVHPELGLPVKVEKFFGNGDRETVFLRELAVDVLLDAAVFTP
ncbi:hypothetical protein [Desulfobotulus sp.]|jgi:outer membrane lipoprotein-sorting protein|uniref:LolA family protein n=1 Tax=Desulfobotulus sp. TaxID=1940337 RepID=UPI002A35A66F|nr:hypothetical protein [Desulfobotulus sp.]MDY0164610.1 hypothetical protein [Desulfobotulus sp.]